MLQLDPHDAKQLSHTLHRAIRDSGLSLTEIVKRLERDYGVSVTVSAIRHVAWQYPVSACGCKNCQYLG